MYAIYVAIIQLCAISFTFKYDLEIPLATNNEKRTNLFVLSILNSIFMIVILIFVIIVFIILFPNSEINKIFIFLPLGIFFQTFFNHILYNWLIYKKNFLLLSLGKMIFTLLYSFIPIALYYFMDLKNFKFIILSHQFGLLFSIIVICLVLYHKSILKIIYKIFSTSFLNLRTTFLEFKKYTIYSTPSHLMNSLGLWLPVLFIWLYFDEKYVALFFLSHRIINTPVLLIGQSIGKIFYSEASNAKINDFLHINVLKYFRILFHVSFYFLFLCIFLIDDIFIVIFTNEWQELIKIIKIFSPWLFIVFLTSPLSTIPTILYKQENEFKFQSILFFARIASLSLGVYFNDVFIMFSLYSITNFTIWFVYLLKIFVIVSVDFKQVIKILIEKLPEKFIIVFSIVILNQISFNPIFTMLCIFLIVSYVIFSFYNQINKTSF